jgi:hypothetical protein
MEIFEIILSIISGLTVCIPLVIKLIEWVRKAHQEKNWAPVMQLVLKFMAEAEELYETGAERKQYVLAAVKEIKASLNYEIDMEVVGTMIDAICAASKKINVKKK